MKISTASLALFLAYASDAPNWSGSPLVGGNVGGTKEQRGNLTQLKRAGLITTDKCEDGHTWISFTDAGKFLAAEHGVDSFSNDGFGVILEPEVSKAIISAAIAFSAPALSNADLYRF